MGLFGNSGRRERFEREQARMEDAKYRLACTQLAGDVIRFQKSIEQVDRFCDSGDYDTAAYCVSECLESPVLTSNACESFARIRATIISLVPDFRNDPASAILQIAGCDMVETLVKACEDEIRLLEDEAGDPFQ